MNRNWESLIRFLHGKPLHEKPQTGKPPAYITADSKAPSNPAAGKFAVFKNAYVAGQRGTRVYRQDFLESCTSYVDGLRPRSQPEGHSGETIIATFRKLTTVRNLIVDWVLLEAQTEASEEFGEVVVQFLERLLELRSRPRDVGSWNETWYDAHRLFAYETFLYVVAALVKAGAYAILNSVVMGHYLRTESDSRSSEHVLCTDFYAYTEAINEALLADVGEKQKIRYHSQAAALLSRCADRTDIPFDALKEADALIVVAAVLRNSRWYPQTHYYWGYGRTAPFFLRAIQHKHFAKLGTTLGVKSGDDLRAALDGKEIKIDTFHGNDSVQDYTCLAKLDTLT